ncbi:hypothetical protein CNY89_30430, partial [Amaricoccus sp. HAR-UPW-R2A-40]
TMIQILFTAGKPSLTKSCGRTFLRGSRETRAGLLILNDDPNSVHRRETIVDEVLRQDLPPGEP